MTEEQIKALKHRHGEIYEAEYGDQKFYFKQPGRIEFKRYYDKLLESVYDAACILVIDLIVAPSPDQLAAIIEKDPSLPIKLVTRLTDFFGTGTVNLKKI